MKDPVEMFNTVVAFGRCDPNGRLNTAQCTALFDRATWPFLEHLGVHDGFGREATMGQAVVRVITEYKHELRLGDSVRLLSSLPRVDNSSVMPRHEMRKVPENTLSATWQSVTVRFDLTGRVSAPMPERLRTLAQ